MPPLTESPPRHGYALAALIVLTGSAAFVYQWTWGRPLWVDEEMIALNLRDRQLSELGGALWLNQAAPLGWMALQRFMLVALGPSERTLRAVPVLFGIAGLVLAWLIGRAWMRPVGAAVFVLLCSFGLFTAFFPLEAKPYSADVFFGLLIPALCVWAIQPTGGRGAEGAGLQPTVRHARVAAWWVVASLSQLFSNGALFAAPGCALVLWTVTWKRNGFRRSILVALPGIVWLAAFGLHYYVTIRHVSGNAHLREYWANGLPPPSAGLLGTLHWFVDRLQPLALDPGGTRWWVAFWVAATGGLALAIATSPVVGLTLASVPLTAVLLAWLRFVPIGGRLSLWTVPALYAAIAIAADEGFVSARQWFRSRNWLPFVPAAGLCLVALAVSLNIFQAGRYELSVRPRSNHSLDDRLAVRFLMGQRKPGDVLVSTRMGLPAIWWYGNIDVGPSNAGRTYEQDGTPILELSYSRGGPECEESEWTDPLKGQSRVAVYLGFDSRTIPGFQELVFDTLSRFGRMISYRRFAEEGVAAVFDLTQPPMQWVVVTTRPGGSDLPPVQRPPGCVGFRQGGLW